MPLLLHVTLTPDGGLPSEGWGFRIDRTGQCGWFIGSLPQAARSALSLARASRRAGVVLTLPRAGWGGLSSQRFVILHTHNTQRLRDVDVERLRARHDAQRRRQLRGEWWAVLRRWAAARMPWASIARH
jgi:hypothetical protein